LIVLKAMGCYKHLAPTEPEELLFPLVETMILRAVFRGQRRTSLRFRILHHRDEGQIPIALGKIQTVSDDELVGNFET
jgi:hypothetical protein